MKTTSARTRALRAAAAVTLTGAVLACGGSQSADDDATETETTQPATVEGSGAEPTSLPGVVVTDPVDEPTSLPGVVVDTLVPSIEVLECKDQADGVCPAGCSQMNDADCCEMDGWCSYDPSYGCGCAVEGPFAPPSLDA